MEDRDPRDIADEDDVLINSKDIKIELSTHTHSGLAALAAAAADETAHIPTSSNNKHTNRKTGADMKIFLGYLLSVNEVRPPQNIPEVELDKHLCNFFLSVKKTDKTEYEPCSLRSMMASIERFLKINGYPSSLTKDPCFSNTRYTLKLKQKVLREMGKGSKPQSPYSIASLKDKTLDRLFEAREMGPYCPSSVVQTLCFVFVVYLRLKKATEHKKLLWGDVILDRDQNGREYITFSDQMLQRCTLQYLKQCQPVVYALPDTPERDPVRIYKLYASKRISTMNYPYAPFYLGINVFNPADNQSWYKSIAMGINKLNDMVRQVREITGVIPSQQSTDDVNDSPQDLSLASSERNSSHSTPESHLSMSNPLLIYKNIQASQKQIEGLKNGLIQNSQEYRNSQKHVINSQLFRPNIDQDSNLTNTEQFKPVLSPDSCSVATEYDFEEDECGSDAENSSDGNGDDDKPTDSLSQDAHKNDKPVKGSESKHVLPRLKLADAQKGLELLLNQLETQDLVKFKKWMKSIDVISDNDTGYLVCQENKKPNNEINSLVSEQQIVLNITLSNNAFRGEQPVTVTATTKMLDKVPEKSQIILPTPDTIPSVTTENEGRSSKCKRPSAMDDENNIIDDYSKLSNVKRLKFEENKD